MAQKRNKPNTIQYLVRKGIRDWANAINGIRPEVSITPPAKNSEAWYRDRLAEKLKGETEVSTPVGRIDILTQTEVIEVKKACNWKNAIGQVKSYGKFYPKHRLRIYLFGEMTESKLKNIQETCILEGILLSWE